MQFAHYEEITKTRLLGPETIIGQYIFILAGTK